MKKYKLLSLILAACAAFSCIAYANESAAYNWYCKRQANHMRPVCDSDMAFVENFGGYYIGKDEKKIYLTFDAGYENGNIEKILDTLAEHDVKGAFFILSNLITTNTDLVRRMADEGHLVCNHTSKHPDMTKIRDIESFKRELEALEEIYQSKTGKQLDKFFRFPQGRFDKRTMQYAQALGYKTVFWSLAYADWDNAKQPNCDYAKKLILENTHNGAVILLHPTSSTNAKILGELIVQWKNDGYEFGSLYDL